MKPAARACLLFAGVVIMSAGIVLVTKSDLGNTPISSTAYVMSLGVPVISYGSYVMIWNMLLLLGQIVILRRRFKAVSLLQVPISLVFSAGVDVFNHVLGFLVPQSYPESFVVLAAGIVVLALGVACTVVPNIVMNSGEAFVSAVTARTGWNFGHTKVGFDLACVALAAIVSLLVMGRVEGVREGSLVAAATTGFVVNFFVRMMGGVRPPMPPRSKRVREEKPSAREDVASAGKSASEAAA